MVAKRASNTTVTNSHDWLTPREVAEYLRTGVDLIYDACATGGLKHVKLGHRTIRVRRRVNPAHHLFFDPGHDVRRDSPVLREVALALEAPDCGARQARPFACCWKASSLSGSTRSRHWATRGVAPLASGTLLERTAITACSSL